MSSAAKIGVVTVTFNSEQVLDDFLGSISGQTHTNFLLYVVDNASSDRSLERVAAFGDPRTRVIESATNVGIAKGNNLGIAAALAEGCDFVLFLNNDIKFGPGMFATMLEEMAVHQCDLLAPKIYFEDGVHIWAAGGGFQVLKGYLGFHAGEGEVDHGQFDTARRIEHAPTCCLLVRPQVFAKIGLIDERYFVYFDDTDFSYRAWRAGLSMFYTPKASILHKVSSLTGGSKSVFSIRHNARGHVYFMLKSLGIWRSAIYLPAWELRLVGKLLFRTIGGKEFLIRQRAFFEGVDMWISQAKRES